jgi:hypothetical protein
LVAMLVSLYVIHPISETIVLGKEEDRNKIMWMRDEILQALEYSFQI